MIRMDSGGQATPDARWRCTQSERRCDDNAALRRISGALDDRGRAVVTALLRPQRATEVFRADIHPRLLMVEDDGDFAGLLLRRLRALDVFTVAHVSRLHHALQHVADHPVDVILLDLFLPDARDLEALTALRDAAPRTAIIILTALVDDAMAMAALVEGAQDFILKDDATSAVIGRAVLYAIERKRQGNELEAREALNRSILDALSSPTVLLDSAGRIVAVNAAWSDLQRDTERNVAVGADYLELCHGPPMDLPPAAELADGLAAILRGRSALFELDYSCGVGDERRWYSVHITPCPSDALGAVVTHVPITRMKLVEEELAHLALHDLLTGLPNRRLLFDRLAQSLARARRAEASVAVVYVDIDHFKSFNDTFGHAVGDAVLMRVAHCLSQVVRPGDTVGHLAGDEFVVLVEDTPDEQSVRDFTSRLSGALREPFTVDGTVLRLTASVGVAMSVCDDTPEQALARADQALYSAKRQGRDRVIWEGHGDDTDLLASGLPAAIEAGELRLHAQPIVRLPDCSVAGHELLVRWQHPDRGLLLPNEFIPQAERSGAIVDLGRWVLHEACRWLRQSTTGFVSINVSALQLQDPALLTILRSARDEGVDVTRLCLEITETAVISDLNRARTLLSRLRLLGAKVAIDDFGAGQTSLRYLHDLPVDILKIDRSLISRLGSDNRAALIVTAVIELGRALNLDVVGEGAETIMQADVLELLGCPFGQGFRWAEPTPVTPVIAA